MNHTEHVRQVMAALGCKSQADLAALLGVGPTAPTNWLQRGMPAKRILQAQEVARARGVMLPSQHQCGTRDEAA